MIFTDDEKQALLEVIEQISQIFWGLPSNNAGIWDLTLKAILIFPPGCFFLPFSLIERRDEGQEFDPA